MIRFSLFADGTTLASWLFCRRRAEWVVVAAYRRQFKAPLCCCVMSRAVRARRKRAPVDSRNRKHSWRRRRRWWWWWGGWWGGGDEVGFAGRAGVSQSVGAGEKQRDGWSSWQWWKWKISWPWREQWIFFNFFFIWWLNFPISCTYCRCFSSG